MTKNESKQWIEKTCGTGWLPLIDLIFNNLPKGLCIESVYQKWGALTVDTSPYDEDFQTYLDKISEKSTYLCEKCGAKAKVREKDGWLRTLCQKHSTNKEIIG